MIYLLIRFNNLNKLRLINMNSTDIINNFLEYTNTFEYINTFVNTNFYLKKEYKKICMDYLITNNIIINDPKNILISLFEYNEDYIIFLLKNNLIPNSFVSNYYDTHKNNLFEHCVDIGNYKTLQYLFDNNYNVDWMYYLNNCFFVTNVYKLIFFRAASINS